VGNQNRGVLFRVPVDTDILPPRYRSPKRIARGGMGEVYRATDSTLGRAVAVKLLAERYSRDNAVRQRFTREGLAAARLSGEAHIVTVFDVGEHAERPFIVMEYLGGGSLEERIREGGAQDVGQALEWLEQAATALDAAHRHGVVHRDVKPANLLLDRHGNVHVADFGIASAAGMDSLTMTGTVLGTAGYLSPEQAQGEHATPASDRYSLAVVAFELLSGRRPFESESITAEAAAHVHAAVPALAEICEGLPDELDPVFRRALAKDPAQRFETASEFVAALRAALAEAAGTTRSLAPVAVGAPAGPTAPTLSRVSRRREAPARWPVLVGLFALAAVAGAIAAIVLTNRDTKTKAAVPPRPKTVTTIVTRQGRTVQTTVTAPTTSPPPPATSPTSLSGFALNLAGYNKMQAGDYAGALPLLQQAVAKLRGVGFPNEAYANYNLGYTLLQLGRCGEAVPYLERAQQLEPQRHEPRDALKRTKHC
jgi:tRNA A-37 threonylcarbamoyl transferase component Bud32